MSFAEVAGEAGLGGELRKGLQALQGPDHERVTCTSPRNLEGSIYLDNAVRGGRWDYVIGWKHLGDGEVAIWLEIHPASSTGNIREIVEKLEWLHTWISSQGQAFKRLPGIKIWLATGRCVFKGTDPKLKQLQQLGVQFYSRRLDIAKLGGFE